MLIGGSLCLLVNDGGFKRVMAELGVGRAEGGGVIYCISPTRYTRTGLVPELPATSAHEACRLSWSTGSAMIRNLAKLLVSLVR